MSDYVEMTVHNIPSRVLEMVFADYKYREITSNDLMVPGTVVVVKDRTYLFTKAGVWVDEDGRIHPCNIILSSFLYGAVQLVRRGKLAND